MNLVADESIDLAIVTELRLAGHDVVYIAELAPSVSDDQVLAEANARNALLVTADKDFGELVYRLAKVHAGVLLLRMAGLDEGAKCQAVTESLRDHGPEMANAFSVLSPGLLRIRS